MVVHECIMVLKNTAQHIRRDKLLSQSYYDQECQKFAGLGCGSGDLCSSLGSATDYLCDHTQILFGYVF